MIIFPYPKPTKCYGDTVIRWYGVGIEMAVYLGGNGWLVKLKRLTIIPENVDAITETVDVYSHLAPFVQLYKDFLSRAHFFQ